MSTCSDFEQYIKYQVLPDLPLEPGVVQLVPYASEADLEWVQIAPDEIPTVRIVLIDGSVYCSLVLTSLLGSSLRVLGVFHGDQPCLGRVTVFPELGMIQADSQHPMHVKMVPDVPLPEFIANLPRGLDQFPHIFSVLRAGIKPNPDKIRQELGDNLQDFLEGAVDLWVQSFTRVSDDNQLGDYVAVIAQLGNGDRRYFYNPRSKRFRLVARCDVGGRFDGFSFISPGPLLYQSTVEG